MDIEWLKDLLLFRTVVAPHVFLLIYYLGAVGIPVLVWALGRTLKRRLSRRDAAEKLPAGPERWAEQALVGNRYVLSTVGFAMFLAMELMWRVLFEFPIAYFQMRDTLLQLTTH